jgi:mono/diheme cytochrome c family protein
MKLRLLALSVLVAGCSPGAEVASTATITSPAPDGLALYAVNCAVCHGPAGEGTVVGPPLVDPAYRVEVFPDAGFVSAVELGVVQNRWPFGPMPAIAGLSHSEIAAITVHVRNLQAGSVTSGG